jgi:hypothetical protein
MVLGELSLPVIMSKRVLIVFLLFLNGFLAVGLIRRGSRSEVVDQAKETGAENQSAQGRTVPEPVGRSAVHPVTATPFASIYSTRPLDFAENLRRAGCPEETVKDILTAEIGRRYRRQEENLRPTPGDHLPRGWSAKTHEAKIIERRQRAAGMVREKEALLRQSLGYDVKVPMPNYAMTVSDQRFQEVLEGLPQEKRNAAHLANEQYWTLVEQLRARTKGFWEGEDIDELRRLKAGRQRAVEALEEAP